MVEGKDIPLLSALQRAVIPRTDAPIASLPAYETGGWGGWHHAIRSRLPKKNGEGKRITTYAFFDSDYHSEAELQSRYAEAKTHQIQLHVWRHKEIENYVLAPDAISRLINRRRRHGKATDAAQITTQIEAIAADLEEETIGTLAEELQRAHRGLGLKAALSRARSEYKARVATDGVIAAAPGKTIVTLLSDWSKSRYGVSFSAVTIAKEMRADEVAPELVVIFEAIEKCQPLSHP